MSEVATYFRLILYPALILGLYLLLAQSRRRAAIFGSAALWLSALEAALILKLVQMDTLNGLVVDYAITPLLALFALSVWWTLWKERKRL